ncbi:hypothetical protein CEXT_688941 [Caerostris extrusa]|uniref:Uncharacterized protein n=1 Tax=Caerostris extrusa TaxID=172846 RepID=A0AAV4P3P0_CAEEX|nr:hypothetical protein CEXT_688941 [Caerostris extrusa]
MALNSAVMAIVGISLVKTYSFVNFHAFSSKAEGSENSEARGGKTLRENPSARGGETVRCEECLLDDYTFWLLLIKRLSG